MAIGRGPTLVVATAVVLAATATTAYALTRGHAPGTAATTTATASRGTVTVSASAAGTVSVVSTRGLSFSTSAVVTELDVKVGDAVVAGQVLARIDGSDAQEAVDAAQQQVTAAQSNLDKAQAPAGTTACAVVAPAALTGLSPSPPARPSPPASPSPSATPSATRAGRPTPDATSARPSRAATCSNGGTGGRGATGDPVANAEQQLNNARLALLQAQQRLAGTVIVAPVVGKVISVGGTVGSQERPGGTGFIVLGDVQDTEVKAQFSEADVARLAVGQAATITVPNHPQPYTGKVAQISPAGTTSGRLVRYGVLVAFDSVPADLLLGQSASVAVTTAQATDVLYVPSSAVTDVNGSGAMVTIRSGGRDRPRTVTIGLRGDRYTEIRSGLSQGDVVVL